jgi:hypothetical protein
MTKTLNLHHYAQALGGEISGDQVLAPGPGHSREDRSLSVKIDDKADGGFVVLSFAGDDPIVCKDYVREKLGQEPWKPRPKKNLAKDVGKQVGEWIYRDAEREPYLRVRKFVNDTGKRTFFQSRWENGQWISGKPRGAKLPYRLPELLAASLSTSVFVVEGEKCAEVLAKLTFIATTNSEGAGKWTSDLNVHFKDRNVVIVADNDAVGHRHTQQVAKTLHGVAASLKVIDLAPHWPGDPMAEGDDVADFIHQHDRAGSNLAKIAREAEEWDPNTVDPKAEEKTEKDKSDDYDRDMEEPLPLKQADALIRLAGNDSLFHTPSDEAYADVVVNGHRKTFKVRGRQYRLLLAERYHAASAGAPSSEGMQSALTVLEARALFRGPMMDVHVRVAGHQGRIYIDLADEKWQAIEVGADGWRVIDSPPVRFQRTPTMRPLPEPTRGGDINELRTFINVRDDAEFVLTVAWLLAALRDTGPYPVLVLTGEQGTAKSSMCRFLRDLVDPRMAPLRTMPKEDRDLFRRRYARCRRKTATFLLPRAMATS